MNLQQFLIQTKACFSKIRANHSRSHGQLNKLDLFSAPFDLPPPQISPLESETSSVFQINSNNLKMKSENPQIPMPRQVQDFETNNFTPKVSEKIEFNSDSNRKTYSLNPKYEPVQNFEQTNGFGEIANPSEIPTVKTFTPDSAPKIRRVQNSQYQNFSDVDVKTEYDVMEYSVESFDYNQNTSDRFQTETPETNRNLPKENLLNIQKASLNLEKFTANASKDKTQIQGINLTENFQKSENISKSIHSFAKVENSEPIKLGVFR